MVVLIPYYLRSGAWHALLLFVADLSPMEISTAIITLLTLAVGSFWFCKHRRASRPQKVSHVRAATVEGTVGVLSLVWSRAASQIGTAAARYRVQLEPRAKATVAGIPITDGCFETSSTKVCFIIAVADGAPISATVTAISKEGYIGETSDPSTPVSPSTAEEVKRYRTPPQVSGIRATTDKGNIGKLSLMWARAVSPIGTTAAKYIVQLEPRVEATAEGVPITDGRFETSSSKVCFVVADADGSPISATVTAISEESYIGETSDPSTPVSPSTAEEVERYRTPPQVTDVTGVKDAATVGKITLAWSKAVAESKLAATKYIIQLSPRVNAVLGDVAIVDGCFQVSGTSTSTSIIVNDADGTPISAKVTAVSTEGHAGKCSFASTPVAPWSTTEEKERRTPPQVLGVCGAKHDAQLGKLTLSWSKAVAESKLAATKYIIQLSPRVNAVLDDVAIVGGTFDVGGGTTSISIIVNDADGTPISATVTAVSTEGHKGKSSFASIPVAPWSTAEEKQRRTPPRVVGVRIAKHAGEVGKLTLSWNRVRSGSKYIVQLHPNVVATVSGIAIVEGSFEVRADANTIVICMSDADGTAVSATVTAISTEGYKGTESFAIAPVAPWSNRDAAAECKSRARDLLKIVGRLSEPSGVGLARCHALRASLCDKRRNAAAALQAERAQIVRDVTRAVDNSLANQLFHIDASIRRMRHSIDLQQMPLQNMIKQIAEAEALANTAIGSAEVTSFRDRIDATAHSLQHAYPEPMLPKIDNTLYEMGAAMRFVVDNEVWPSIRVEAMTAVERFAAGMVDTRGAPHPIFEIQQESNVMRRIMALAAPTASSGRAERLQWARKVLALGPVMHQFPIVVSISAAPQAKAIAANWEWEDGAAGKGGWMPYGAQECVALEASYGALDTAPSPLPVPLATTDGGGHSLTEGSVVTARWRGGSTAFPGYVRTVHPDGTMDVQYDDGDFEPKVRRERVSKVNGKKPVAVRMKATKSTAVQITNRSGTYNIDIATMKQKKQSTGYERAVRRITVPLTPSSGSSAKCAEKITQSLSLINVVAKDFIDKCTDLISPGVQWVDEVNPWLAMAVLPKRTCATLKGHTGVQAKQMGLYKLNKKHSPINGKDVYTHTDHSGTHLYRLSSGFWVVGETKNMIAGTDTGLIASTTASDSFLDLKWRFLHGSRFHADPLLNVT